MGPGITHRYRMLTSSAKTPALNLLLTATAPKFHSKMLASSTLAPVGTHRMMEMTMMAATIVTTVTTVMTVTTEMMVMTLGNSPSLWATSTMASLTQKNMSSMSRDSTVLTLKLGTTPFK